MREDNIINLAKNNNLNLENQKLRNEIKNLLAKVSSLELENSALKSRVSLLSSSENEVFIKNEKIKKQNEQIKNLQDRQLEILKEKNAEVRNLDNTLKKEISILKTQQESNSIKVENAGYVLKFNDVQYNKILELENQIQRQNEEEKKKLLENEYKHEIQFTNLKQKMMDRIKAAQKNMAQNNNDNMNLNAKLNKLATNQLLIELEDQSNQIEDLIKIKEKYAKKIFVLKTDLDTHKKVEQLLQEKNKKYCDMIKKFNEKNEENFLNRHKEAGKSDNISNSRVNTAETQRKYKKYNFEQLYKDQAKEFYNLKDVNDTLRTKLNNYEKKFSGIINLYKNALDELTKDKEFQNLKDIYVNIEDIKNGNFEDFTKEQKYSIIVYLIKHLIPLIDNYDSSENVSIQKLKEEFKNVEVNGTDQFYNRTLMSFRSYNLNKRESSANVQNVNRNFNKTLSRYHFQTSTRFPKIEHLFLETKSKDNSSLYKFLDIK